MLRTALRQIRGDEERHTVPQETLGRARQPHFMKEWRLSHGLTLKKMSAKLAERCGYRITSATLSRVENGIYEYRQDMLEAYAAVLGCAPADLLARKPTDPDVVWAEIIKVSSRMRLARELKARRKNKPNL